jgi:ribosomal protein L11 methyltransferase
MEYIEITIAVKEQGQKDILVAQLSELGFDGFEEERHRLKAFIPADSFEQLSFSIFAQEHGFDYTVLHIPQTNWNALWESGYKPVRVGDFCVVRAAFHEPVKDIAHDIVITPKMSFGTGHHATTYMMIQAMSSIDFSNKSVFDFGTGTGVLAILAVQLGADRVVAIDNDDLCITNATENLEMNNCTKRVDLYKDTTLPPGKSFDIILANINRGIIVQNLLHMKQHLSHGGVILISGLLATDRQIIEAESQKVHLQVIRGFEKDGWICLLLDNL